MENEAALEKEVGDDDGMQDVMNENENETPKRNALPKYDESEL